MGSLGVRLQVRAHLSLSLVEFLYFVQLLESFKRVTYTDLLDPSDAYG